MVVVKQLWLYELIARVVVAVTVRMVVVVTYLSIKSDESCILKQTMREEVAGHPPNHGTRSRASHFPTNHHPADCPKEDSKGRKKRDFVPDRVSNTTSINDCVHR